MREGKSEGNGGGSGSHGILLTSSSCYNIACNVYLYYYCRRVGSQSARQWLDRLQREKVPVLVCLTFADKFYEEHMSEEGHHPTKAEMDFCLHDQLAVSSV